MGLTAADIEKIKNIFNEQFLQVIVEKVINMVQQKLDERFENQEKTIKELQREIVQLKASNTRTESVLDNQEQASRSLNIRIFNVPFEENENLRMKVLNIFNKNLKLSIKDAHLRKCHRVQAKKASDRPPAILVTFFSDTERKSVLKSRRLLKSSNVQIREDLTKFRLSLLSSAINKFTYKNAWCLNGVVYAKCGDLVHRINSVEDLDNVFKSAC